MLMPDYTTRRTIALMLRRFAAGRITSDELDDAFADGRSADSAVAALHDFAVGGLYGSFDSHRCRADHALSRSSRRLVARMVLFLRTDLDFEWPDHGYAGFRGGLWRFVTLGLLQERYDRDWQRSRDADVWPFARRPDLKAALARPPFLRGAPPN